MTSDQLIIQTIDITKIFGMGDVSVAALKGIDVEIAAGEFVAIMGPSGSGKSTLLHILGCLSQPTAGTYILDGDDISSMDKRQLATIRNRKIGFVFQNYNLLARTSALRNVTLPLLYDHTHEKNDAAGDEKARMVLDLVGLSDRMHHQPHELSGGQQQRVAIARALANDPFIIVADEPTGSLDSVTADHIFDIFERLVEEGKTIVMVTHDNSLAPRFSRHLSIQDGRIISDNPIRESGKDSGQKQVPGGTRKVGAKGRRS
jgi:putative ABC transport system ATP-binding protein